MIIIPAIDLKDGKCVRLFQGRMDQETVYSENPIEIAKNWVSKGAERLHVVDLNGAVTGKPYHSLLIEEMVHSVSIPVQVGGGIRDIETIEAYLKGGVEWVILGTAALSHRNLIEEACRRYPKRVILGIDAKKGQVAVNGWMNVASIKAIELAKEYEGMGISAVIFTDIERDGMEKGLNFLATKEFARSISIPVIASGGVSSIKEIEDILTLECDGVIGIIIGRALYTGQIDLTEAIRIGKRS
ncbi:MAG: 1-(5-phosphoribosyl)-5-[(5-phosphoribosylamino)methylideneamino]imidazole-4-carboxamide isomerase [Thermodesulfobacteriota bacterium]